MYEFCNFEAAFYVYNFFKRNDKILKQQIGGRRKINPCINFIARNSTAFTCFNLLYQAL